MATREIPVPDIGDFKNIPVIEIFVKPGDVVAKDAALVTLESDKATVEVPAPMPGTIKELKVKIGDRVSKGSIIVTLEVADAAAASAPAPKPESGPPASSGQKESPAAAAPSAAPAKPAAPPAPAHAAGATSAPAVAPGTGAAKHPDATFHADVLVLGSGPGGYTAAFRAADLGKKVVLVERYPRIGGVCLNVGCIPSKALLHAAKVITDADEGSHLGLSFGKPKIDLEGLRKFKDGVVTKLTSGLGVLAKARKVTVVEGRGQFASPHLLAVETKDGIKTVSFDHCIIAAGSQSARIPGFPYDDKRLMDSTGALELTEVPKRLLIIGGGIIGLEMATVYDALGAKVTVVEFLDRLIATADPDIVRPLSRRIEKRYEKILLKTKVSKLEALPEGMRATFESADAAVTPAGARDLRSRAAGRGAPPERKEHRRRQGRRERQRARLHPRRQPDAHQRAAHLRHRRHRRRSDAGPQGDPRGEAGRRGDRRDEPPRLGGPHDPQRGLHRSRGRLDGADRDRGEGQRRSPTTRRCSTGAPAAARSAWGARKASPRSSSPRRASRSWAPASSASTRAS